MSTDFDFRCIENYQGSRCVNVIVKRDDGINDIQLTLSCSSYEDTPQPRWREPGLQVHYYHSFSKEEWERIKAAGDAAWAKYEAVYGT